jgi:hypothetical protein
MHENHVQKPIFHHLNIATKTPRTTMGALSRNINLKNPSGTKNMDFNQSKMTTAKLVYATN